MSSKWTFSPHTFASWTFASGTFRGVGITVVPDVGWLSTDMTVDTVLRATMSVKNSLDELTTIQNGALATMETGSHNGD